MTSRNIQHTKTKSYRNVLSFLQRFTAGKRQNRSAPSWDFAEGVQKSREFPTVLQKLWGKQCPILRSFVFRACEFSPKVAAKHSIIRRWQATNNQACFWKIGPNADKLVLKKLRANLASVSDFLNIWDGADKLSGTQICEQCQQLDPRRSPTYGNGTFHR